MKGTPMLLALAVSLAPAGLPLYAQDRPMAEPALHSMPNEVPAGTRFLISLQDKLGTKDSKPGKHFKARTLEPLATPDGMVVPPGAEVRGHIDKIERAGLTGRARIWLTLDDVRVPGGRMPLIAEVTGAPGERSIKADGDEGDIASRSDKGTREAEAAVAGAAIGAAAGGAARGGKGAAIGAAIGAASGFIATSSYGQELTLQKNTKLEITLERPLYLGRT